MNKYQNAYKRLSSKTYQYAGIKAVYEDIETLGELVIEQEPIKPVNTGTEVFCSNCSELLDSDLWVYCPYCGRKVDWGNDDE